MQEHLILGKLFVISGVFSVKPMIVERGNPLATLYTMAVRNCRYKAQWLIRAEHHALVAERRDGFRQQGSVGNQSGVQAYSRIFCQALQPGQVRVICRPGCSDMSEYHIEVRISVGDRRQLGCTKGRRQGKVQYHRDSRLAGGGQQGVRKNFSDTGGGRIEIPVINLQRPTSWRAKQASAVLQVVRQPVCDKFIAEKLAVLKQV